MFPRRGILSTDGISGGLDLRQGKRHILTVLILLQGKNVVKSKAITTIYRENLSFISREVEIFYSQSKVKQSLADNSVTKCQGKI